MKIFLKNQISPQPCGHYLNYVARRVRPIGFYNIRQKNRGLGIKFEGVVDFSSKVTDSLAHLAEGTRMDAVHGEDDMRHESLAREQCHRIQANERDKLQREEALERERMLREEATLREEKMRADGLAREELNIAREKSQAEIKARNKQFKRQASNELQQQKLEMEMKMQIAHMELMERRELEFQQEKLREKDITAKEMEAHLLLERQLAEEKRKTLTLEYEAKFRRHENVESRRLAPIPERETSLGIEQRGHVCTGVHQQCTYSVPMPSLAHSYSLLESLPRVPETTPKFAQPVVTPALGTFPILAPPVLGQLSVVSATHTVPTVPLNLGTVPQARPGVVSSSVVASGAAVSTAARTAPSYLVPVANTQLPVKPQAGTMPTPIATSPTQSSVLGSIPPVAATATFRRW